MSIPQEESAENRYDCVFKIVFVGEKGVGKTSLIRRLVLNSFTASLPSVVNVGVWECELRMYGLCIKLKIWDTPGRQVTSNIAPNFFRSADAVVIVFDHTKRQSFLNLDEWLTLILRVMDNSFVPFIVGTKCDVEDPLVSIDEVSEFAERNDIKTFLTSALTGYGVERMIKVIVHRLLSVAQENRGFSLGDIGRVATRTLFGGWSLGRLCCGGLRHPADAVEPLTDLITGGNDEEVRDVAIVREAGASNENLLVGEGPNASARESLAALEIIPTVVAESPSSMRSGASTYGSEYMLRDESEEETRRRRIDTSSSDENPARVVHSAASAVDPATPSTSRGVGDGGTRDPAHTFPSSDSESSRPDSHSDTTSTASASSANDRIAAFIAMNPEKYKKKSTTTTTTD